jgi:hypothetical protein
MTAIEEAGKLSLLRFFAHTQAQKPGVDLQDLDTVRLSKFLRDHPEKAREAAASSCTSMPEPIVAMERIP